MEKHDNRNSLDLSSSDKVAAIFKVITEWDVLAKYHSDEFWSHYNDNHLNVAGKHEAAASAYASCSGQLKELLKLWGTPQSVI